MKLSPVILFFAFLVLPAHGQAETPARPPVDIFKTDWLVSFFPPTLLVVPPKGVVSVEEQFRLALTTLRSATPAKLVDFPAGQHPPVVKDKERWAGPQLRSGEAGFVVLVSQTGRVVAFYVAFCSSKEWAQEVAKTVAEQTFEPARINGKAVPVLIFKRWAFERRINFR